MHRPSAAARARCMKKAEIVRLKITTRKLTGLGPTGTVWVTGMKLTLNGFGCNRALAAVGILYWSRQNNSNKDEDSVTERAMRVEWAGSMVLCRALLSVWPCNFASLVSRGHTYFLRARRKNQ